MSAHDLSAERWERLQKIFDQALALPVPERASFLDTTCAGDDDLRQRAVSWEPSRLIEPSVTCHGMAARMASIDRAIWTPSRPGWPGPAMNALSDVNSPSHDTIGRVTPA